MKKFILLFALVCLVFSDEIVIPQKPLKYGGPVIGIDLGTTYSCVGIYKEGAVQIIPNDQGSRITPSVVSFAPNGGYLVGEAAKNNLASNPKNTIYDVKRLIGRKFNEVLKIDKDLFTYDLVDVDGKVYVKSDATGESKTYSPEQISAFILAKMKKIAEDYLGEEVKHAVVTVPAYFNDAQKEATKNAGTIAGLDVIRIIAEPTAASLAYGMGKNKEEEVIVFDLGGGTFDVSLLTIDGGMFDVRATNGDMHLGGEDFDLRLTSHLAKQFQTKHGKDIMADKKAFQKLKGACEKAKRILSTELETTIEIESLIGGIDYSAKVTRALFNEVNKDLFDKTLNPIRQVLADTKLKKEDIDVVVMVGGSTRIPKIRELVSQFFDGKKLEFEVNPDEAIGWGAAVQGGILNGINDGPVISDIAPLSLGIETVGGIMSKIVHRGTKIPCEKYDTFTTTEDYQTQLAIPIYEGERPQTKHNRLLGELQLTDIPPARKGHPQIKVSFKLDTDGLLKVVAEDTATKNKKEITIKKGFLTVEDVERMQKDAADNAKEDEEFKRSSEARLRLDNYLETTRANIANKNIANRIKSKDRKKITRALSRITEWQKDSEAATKKEIYDKLVELKKIVQPILAKLTGEQIEEFPTDEPAEEKKEDKKEEKNTINIEEKKDEL